MNICLVFPPHWTPTMPHLALPWLTSLLRQNGHTVIQRDLNIEVFDTILTTLHLRKSLRRIKQRFGADGKARFPGVNPASLPTPDQVQQALKRGPALAEKVEKAKRVLRSQQFYDGNASLPAFLTCVEALELDSLAHYPAHLDFAGFSDALRPDISQDLLVSARSPDINPFLEIFENGILQDLKQNPPDLVGISIPTQGQFLAGITLASLIRRAGLKCHITAGGPHISMLREQIPDVPALFDLFDSFVLFDGELPALRLAEAVQSGSSFEEVPNLIYRQPGSGEIRTNPLIPVNEVRLVQKEIEPDFDGLPLDRYLAPDLVLPLISAHGCYHGKCAFCNVGYGDSLHYYPYPVEHIARQMKSVQEKYHCTHVFFVDEAIPPRTLRGLAEALSAQETPIYWCGAVRFEKALTTPLLEKIASNGCLMLLFGLESAAEPVMQRMIKGTQAQEMDRILHAGAAAGIWNHVFFFFGFPGEKLDDAQQTVNFVYAHQDVIHSASPGAFLLERYSPAFLAPQKFGIRRFTTPPQHDLAIYYDYEVDEGLDEKTANRLADRLVEQLPDKTWGQYYINDSYKLLYASELHRQGKPMPRWIE